MKNSDKYETHVDMPGRSFILGKRDDTGTPNHVIKSDKLDFQNLCNLDDVTVTGELIHWIQFEGCNNIRVKK
jgi:hypothetical protein